MKSIDFSQVEHFFNLVYIPNHCVEVRCLSSHIDSKTNRIVRSKYDTCVSGWFTKFDELECELSRIDSVSCYMSVNPASLGRRPFHAKNCLKILNAKRGEFVNDSDINIIRYIIIDIDSVRPLGLAKSNSTNEELSWCLEVKEKIVNEMGLSDHCLHGISGNGAFILVRVPDYPKDDEVRIEISRFVNEISKRYSNERCRVDTDTTNPSRHLGIPGTWKCKNGVDSPYRPYRRVEIQGGSYGMPLSAAVRPESLDKG